MKISSVILLLPPFLNLKKFSTHHLVSEQSFLSADLPVLYVMEFHTCEEKFNSIMEKSFTETRQSLSEFYINQKKAIDEGLELIFSDLRLYLNSTDSDSYPDETNNSNCDLEIQSDAESDSRVLKTEIPLIVVTDVEQRTEGHQNRQEEVLPSKSQKLKLPFEEHVPGLWEAVIRNWALFANLNVYDTGQSLYRDEEFENHGNLVVVSIYVNPGQSSPSEDLSTYPSDFNGDLSKLMHVPGGVDAVFNPYNLYDYENQDNGVNCRENRANLKDLEGGKAVSCVEEKGMGHETGVRVERLEKGMCGKSRPVFFRGVATVVSKLFSIVEPDFALFGKKDYQQLRIIQRMVRDLDFSVKVIGFEIIRDNDGLAMSSRNVHLSPKEREKPLSINKSLFKAKSFAEGGQVNCRTLRDLVIQAITEARGKIDYAEIVDQESLDPVEELKSPVVFGVAAWFGKGSLRAIFEEGLCGGRKIVVERLVKYSGKGGEGFKNEVAWISNEDSTVEILGLVVNFDCSIVMHSTPLKKLITGSIFQGIGSFETAIGIQLAGFQTIHKNLELLLRFSVELLSSANNNFIYCALEVMFDVLKERGGLLAINFWTVV